MLDLETVSGRSNQQVSHDRCIKKRRFKKGLRYNIDVE